MTANKTAEARYSIYTPDGRTWRIWDERDSRFVQNPLNSHPTVEFDSRESAETAIADLVHEEARAERIAARQSTEAPAGRDDEPTATAPVTIALPKPQDHLRKQPRNRSAKPGTHVQRAIVAYRNRAVVTVAGYLAERGV